MTCSGGDVQRDAAGMLTQAASAEGLSSCKSAMRKKRIADTLLLETLNPVCATYASGVKHYLLPQSDYHTQTVPIQPFQCHAIQCNLLSTVLAKNVAHNVVHTPLKRASVTMP